LPSACQLAPRRYRPISARTRFQCPSASLTLRPLLKRTQTARWIGLALVIAVHAALSQLRGFAQEQNAAKPLTTHFVKRQPRLTKPLELKKRPAPRQRRVQRKMIAVTARAERRDTSSRFQAMGLVRGFAKPRVSVARAASVGERTVEPRASAQAVESSVTAKHTVDMSLELLDVEALDTGQYHALVVQDPTDRKNIRGFCRLGVIYSDNMYDTSAKSSQLFQLAIMPAFLRVVDTMNRYTDIKTSIFGRITLDDAELFRTPWVYFMAFCGFQLSEPELEALGRYAISGGFVFADTYWVHPEHRAGSKGVVRSLTNALQRQGIKQVLFEILPNTHPIYHCYFDFDGAPTGAGATGGEPKYLEGAEVDGRLCVILSKKAYYGPWSHYGTDRFDGAYKGRDPERALQFGVNLIVFALIQEGSITNRVMDSVQ